MTIPGQELQALTGLVSGPEEDYPERLVFVSVSTLEGGLADVRERGGVLLVGGDPDSVESAVACGSLDAPSQAETDLGIELAARLESGYWGTALLHEADGAVTVTIVLTSPATPDDRDGPDSSASASLAPRSDASTVPSAGREGSDAPSAAPSVAPRPSVQPGTSGAPPFSPLPAGSDDP